MATQFDILRQFNNELDRMANANEISTRQAISMQEKLINQQKNIYKLKKDIYTSDYKGLNVFKRFLNVGNKLVDHYKKVSQMKKAINTSDEQILKLTKEINKLNSSGNNANSALLAFKQKQLSNLTIQNKMNKVQLSQMKEITKGAGMFSFILMGVVGTTLKIISSLSKLSFQFAGIFFRAKEIFSTFLNIQKITGNIAADIGLTRNESKYLLNNIANLTISASKFGGTIEDVATIYKNFSENTNKNRLFNAKEVEVLTELGLGTGLGVEGATALAAAFDNIGISLKNTINLTDKARNLAARYNVNTTKVLKTYQALVTSLSGIGFGKGLDNLAKLAAKSTAIRFDIAQSTKTFVDAFFDFDKATEAAAQMQVLGGRFASSFGDPIQLAFQSMNNPAKLAEDFSQILKDKVIKKGSEFIISPVDRQMLRIAATTLGQNYDDIYNSTIEQAKTADKIAALNKSGLGFGFSDDDRVALGSLMTLNEKGKYEIRLSDGTTNLLENVTTSNQLKQILDARKSNEKAAIERNSLMERLELIINRFTYGFSTVLTKLFGSTNMDNFLSMVENAGVQLATLISKHFTGNNSAFNLIDRLTQKAMDIFKNLEAIFSNTKDSFLGKVFKSIGVILKDVLYELMVSLIPIFKAGFGSMFVALKDVPIIGKSLNNTGIKMQQEALSHEHVRSLYGDDMINQTMLQKTNNNSFIQGAGLAGKSLLSAKNIPKGITQGIVGPFGKNAIRLAKVGMKRGGKFGVKAGAMASSRIPIVGSLASLGLSGYDLYEGDYAGAGLNLLSALANLSNVIVPGVGSAASMGIDGINAAREMGAFNDGVIYKDGSYAKFSKGDMVQFIDQTAYEKANNISNSTNNSQSVVNHTGTITIKSDDGKVVTWEQMYGAAGMVGSGIQSSLSRFENGYGTNLHPNNNIIKPLL